MRGRNFNGLGSLSGHASSMIASIKSNSRRKEIENFKRSKKILSYRKSKPDKKASPQLLKEIRERVQKENRRNTRLAIIFMSSIILILYILFNFVKF